MTALNPNATIVWSTDKPYTSIAPSTSTIGGYTGELVITCDGSTVNVPFTRFIADETPEATPTPVTLEDVIAGHFSVQDIEDAGAVITISYEGDSISKPVTLQMAAQGEIINNPTTSYQDSYVFSTLNDIQYLKDGHNGTPVPYTKVVGKLEESGLGLYYNGNDYYANLLCAPGRYESPVWNKMIAIAEKRQDILAILDLPYGLSRDEAVAFHNGKYKKLPEGEAPEKAINSSYAAIFWPWQKIYNEFTEAYEWIPPSGLVAGAMAQTDRDYKIWYAPAGLKRGMLNLSLATEVNLGKDDTDILYSNGNVINPIVNYKGKGIVIWGQRTATREASAVDRINVRRMMMQVRKTVEESTAYFVFDPNDKSTWDSWLGTITPYLDTIVIGRGFREYKIVMDETTVTDEAQDRNEMPGIVYIKPTKTAEFIPIDFVLVSQTATL